MILFRVINWITGQCNCCAAFQLFRVYLLRSQACALRSPQAKQSAMLLKPSIFFKKNTSNPLKMFSAIKIINKHGELRRKSSRWQISHSNSRVFDRTKWWFEWLGLGMRGMIVGCIGNINFVINVSIINVVRYEKKKKLCVIEDKIKCRLMSR